MLGGACLLLPLLRQTLPVLPFFLPLDLFLVAIMALVTATLLLVRARIEANVALAVLAAAYVFVVPLIIGTALALPENIIWRGFAGPGHEVAADCFTLARVGFSAGLLLYALVSLPARERRVVLPFWGPPVCAFGLSSVCIALIFGANDHLPDLIAQNGFSPLHAQSCMASLLLSIAAIGVLTLRSRALSTIECWASVAASATALEALVAVFMNERYSLGFYAARGFDTVGYAAVLGAILVQASRVASSVSERLSAEEALRTLAETIPQIVWTARPTGDVDWVNKRWFDYAGRSDVALEDRWQAVVHAADLANFKRLMLLAGSDAGDFEVDLRLRGVDGIFRWFLTRVVPMRDEHGRVARWYGTSTNVDEERRHAAHLRDLFAREHRFAATLQTAFLPASFPSCAGLAFSHVYLPAAADENLGGDWYDAFAVGERRIAVCVGDVSGHGIDAAVRMLRVRELLRAAAFDDPAPSIVLERAAHSLGAEDPEQTVTALFGVIDTRLGTFTYASAGHPPPAFSRAGAARSLAFGGLPLGVELRPKYEDHTLGLRDGDVIALFTDGLIEAARDPIEGERRLHAVLASGIIDARALASELVPAQQLDDVAVATIAIGLLGPAEREPQPWHFKAAEATGASGARASFAQYYSACGANEDEVMRAEHAFGELLGNVVRHAPGPVEVELTWHAGIPYLSVADRGSKPWSTAARLEPPALAESGRGLLILRSFGMQPLGTAREGGGTRMVVALPYRAREHASAPPGSGSGSRGGRLGSQAWP